ncbi:MAG: hypothetical protein O7D30_09550, partial [Rickettsia endosymbiont of Ixodes persulcatus]|nr:hypothetical protein [Rickettsia endosymbiont of Ixodes persulcatus]
MTELNLVFPRLLEIALAPPLPLPVFPHFRRLLFRFGSLLLLRAASKLRSLPTWRVSMLTWSS